MKRPRFTVNITHYHWHCGDGCCSDSGYKLRVDEHKPEKRGTNCLILNDDWNANQSSDCLLDKAIESIERILQRSVKRGTDYRIVHNEEYSDDE